VNQQATKAVFENIPRNGRYERDLLHSMVHKFSQKNIEDALKWLCERGFVRKCGDATRPLYVRLATASVVYTNITPLDEWSTTVMLELHSAFKKVMTK